MSGEPVTPLHLVAWLGAAIGKGLRQLREALCKLGRLMRREFVEAYHAERQRVPQSSPKPKTHVRAFGFVLIWFQVVALILLATEYGSFNEIVSGRILIWPPAFGIAIAGLWSFPNVWRRIPFIFQKLVLLSLVVILQATFWLVLTLPLSSRVAALFGSDKDKVLAIAFAVSALCSGMACLVILFSKRKPRQVVAMAGGQ